MVYFTSLKYFHILKVVFEATKIITQHNNFSKADGFCLSATWSPIFSQLRATGHRLDSAVSNPPAKGQPAQ